ncbi:MAG: MDR family oxidoreductase [Pseudoxanthomonas sp.]
MTFRAIQITRNGGLVQSSLVDMEDEALMPGDVTVKVDYSTINYKDALALTGTSPIAQVFPLVGGIDLAGTVEASEHPDFEPGDAVLVNGWDLSQTHHGGYAQRARVHGRWLVKTPAAFTSRQAMAIGTAGYTAMLCVLALEHAGVTPGQGDVLVTGANGGVGSVAIALLHQLGYRVLASTGRMEDETHLKALGAAELIDRKTLGGPGKPLGPPRWIAAVDSVGSHTLANVLAHTSYRGAVAACGLAQGADLPASVLPFILRNVTLAGIDSVNAPHALRLQAWERLARDLDPAVLEQMTTEIGLGDVLELAPRMLQGQVRGRTVVNVNA